MATAEELKMLMGYGLADGEFEFAMPIVIKEAVEELIDEKGKIILKGEAEVVAPKSISPTFILKTPSNATMKEFRRMSNAKNKKIDEQEALYILLNKVIAGWSNMINPTNGEIVEYAPEKVDELPVKAATSVFLHVSKVIGLI